MVNKGVLSRNYFIDPETVTGLGAEVYNMMLEADQAMAEASEIIAEIASLTERVPSQIRCGALLEACAAAQEEIKNVDFLSYGLRVNQGLQNLLDHNQYITEHFIKNMEMNTEKMRGLGEEFRRLADSITYSGENAQSKGIAFSAVSNVKAVNIDGVEENLPDQGREETEEAAADGTDMTGWDDMFPREGLDAAIEEAFIIYADEGGVRSSDDILKYFMSCDKETQIAIKLLDAQICNRLEITDTEERRGIIQTILDEKPYIFDNLYILNTKSGADYERYMFNTLFDIEQKNRTLDAQGYLFLCESEIGVRSGWDQNENLRLDEDGNIIAIKIHDVGDGGYTIGPGIFIAEDNQERIDLAISLGIDWKNTNEWVSIENVNRLFSSIAQEYDVYTKYIELETGVIFTPLQYAAVYDLVYFRPFLRFYYVDLIKENADRDVWITTLINAVRNQAGEDAWSKFGNGWTARIERSVNSYFDGVYYPKE